MAIEITLLIAITVAILLVAAHAWWSQPVSQYVPDTVEVGHVAAALPPPKPHDVLEDYARLLEADDFPTTAGVDQRLAVLEALLEEADHETVRLELLVNKLGRQLLPT